MDQLISVIIFSIPGLLVYFWVRAFGMNPAVQHSVTELIGISAIYWIPTAVLGIATFDVLYFIFDNLFKLTDIDFTFLKLNYLSSLSDIKDLSTNLYFIVYFFVSSIIYSYIVARIWFNNFDKLLAIINKVRFNKGLAKLSDNTSVWEEVFLNDNPQVVGIGKIDKEGLIIGCIQKASRAFEAERIYLSDIDYFTRLVELFDIPISNIYVDIKSGTIIKIYDAEKIRDAQVVPTSSDS
jgi:hypothetical protein